MAAFSGGSGSGDGLHGLLIFSGLVGLLMVLIGILFSSGKAMKIKVGQTTEDYEDEMKNERPPIKRPGRRRRHPSGRGEWVGGFDSDYIGQGT